MHRAASSKGASLAPLALRPVASPAGGPCISGTESYAFRMTPQSPVPQSPELSHARELARSQQNLVGAAVAGSVVALLCAVAWAVLTLATDP